MSSNETVLCSRFGNRGFVLLIAALTALSIALSAPAAGRAATATHYGVQITDLTDTDFTDALDYLGVKRVRMVAGLGGENPDLDIRQVADSGYDILLTVTEGATFPAGPLVDVQGFKDALNNQLNDLQGRPGQVPLVSVENEMTADNYYTGDPSDYLQELRAAVGPVHNHGAKISDGGLPSPVAQLVTWNYLWNTTTCPPQGGPGPADEYADETFGLEGYPWDIIDAIPSCMDPNKQLTGTLADLLAKGNALLTGYAGVAGLDYVNFHWYQSTPDALETTVGVLKTITHKPVISNEMGQWVTDSGETLTALLQRAAELQMPWVTWFGSDGGKAIGLFDDDGPPYPRAQAFKTLLAECDDVTSCG